MEVLTVSDLVCGYHEAPVVHGVSFSLQRGEVLGIIGPNGSGKTTLLRAISGYLRPFAGSVRLNGQEVHRLARTEIARRIAFVSQDIQVDFSFTVDEIVLMGRTPHLGRLGWETRRDREIVVGAMRFLDVDHLADRPISEVSGGERQRVFIAMALAQLEVGLQREEVSTPAGLLLLDEPTAHLDIDHQVGIMDLIHRSASQLVNGAGGVSVILVSHDLNVAAEYCDRLIFLSQGRVHITGTPDEVLTEEHIREVYKTRVRVERNPATNRPHVLLLPTRHLAEGEEGRQK